MEGLGLVLKFTVKDILADARLSFSFMFSPKSLTPHPD